MAKQQVVQFDNGATLIYQKQNSFNGYSFVIGFNSGAKLDGRYKGLSHLLEHLLFRGVNESITQNILDNILRYTINQNAFTGKEFICMDFSATQDNVGLVLDNCMKMLMNKNFTPEQIAREVEIVKHEIRRQREYAPNIIESFLEGICNTPQKEVDVLGNPKSLAKITPEVLKAYVERYFNTENLIISVTSNKPLQEVIALCNDKIISRVPQAKDARYIIGYPELKEYLDINLLIASPLDNVPDVELALLLRERNTPPENIDKEYAVDVLESYMMNTIGGILWNALRIDKSLVYKFQLEHIDLGNAKFKDFYVSTSKAKMNATIQQLCGVIRHIAENGIDEKLFNAVKNAIVEQDNSVLHKFRKTSALSNFENFFEGVEFIDYKNVMKYIKEMTLDEFNASIQQVYADAKVSLVAQGNFDSRKFYNLIEIEQMLGNYSHSDEIDRLNAPRVEYTTNSDYKIDLSQILSQIGAGVEVVDGEEDEEESEPIEPVDIEDNPVC